MVKSVECLIPCVQSGVPLSVTSVVPSIPGVPGLVLILLVCNEAAGCHQLGRWRD